jgi:hypothetical protein
MKKATIFLLCMLALGASSCMINYWDTGISGNGNVIEETRDISGFTGIQISSGIDVYLSEGDQFEVRVEADENLMDVIETELKGKDLVVKTEDRVSIRRAESKKVHVTLPDLKEVKISSAGDCRGQTMFYCDDLRLGISSAGDLSLEVEARRIDIEISSSGDAKISGQAEVLNASLSSAGGLDAYNLIAGKVDVDVSSAGDARVHATEEISMNASSAGDIYYKGDARVVNSRSSSAGKIVHKD